jgi:hypothetical protein
MDCHVVPELFSLTAFSDERSGRDEQFHCKRMLAPREPFLSLLAMRVALTMLYISNV